MTTPEKIGLSALPRELAAFTGKPAPDYRHIYGLTLNARLPAEHIRGRWYVSRADLPAIAAALGMEAETPPKPRRAGKRQIAEAVAA